jgi:hypothetical protein
LLSSQVFLRSVDACDYDLRRVWVARRDSVFIIAYDFRLDTFFGEGIGKYLGYHRVSF